jgi:hypothetical protein
MTSVEIVTLEIYSKTFSHTKSANALKNLDFAKLAQNSMAFAILIERYAK